jgi:hypothetical protein
MIPPRARVLVPAGKGIFRERWVATDVVIGGPVTLHHGNKAMDPVLCGAGIGPDQGETDAAFGTLGCVAAERGSGRPVLLTCRHVVPDRGMAVHQPGSPPFPGPNTQVGAVLRTAGGEGGDADYRDTAVISIGPTRKVEKTCRDKRVQAPTGYLSKADVTIGMKIHMCGAGSDYSQGTIDGLGRYFGYSGVLFITCSPATRAGDSGGIWMPQDKAPSSAVAMHFGSPGGGKALAIPFYRIAADEELAITMPPAQPVGPRRRSGATTSVAGRRQQPGGRRNPPSVGRRGPPSPAAAP